MFNGEFTTDTSSQFKTELYNTVAKIYKEPKIA